MFPVRKSERKWYSLAMLRRLAVAIWNNKTTIKGWKSVKQRLITADISTLRRDDCQNKIVEINNYDCRNSVSVCILQNHFSYHCSTFQLFILISFHLCFPCLLRYQETSWVYISDETFLLIHNLPSIWPVTFILKYAYCYMYVCMRFIQPTTTSIVLNLIFNVPISCPDNLPFLVTWECSFRTDIYC